MINFSTAYFSQLSLRRFWKNCHLRLLGSSTKQLLLWGYQVDSSTFARFVRSCDEMLTGQVGVLWTGCLSWRTTLEWNGSTRTSGFSVVIVWFTGQEDTWTLKQMNQALLQVSIENSFGCDDTERLSHWDLDRSGNDGNLALWTKYENAHCACIALLYRTTLTRPPSWHPCLPTQSLLPASVWRNPTTPISNSLQMYLPVLMSTSTTPVTGAVILQE